MAKVGIIRNGDKTSCGGTVTGGDPTFVVHGREIAPVGTAIVCARDCKIVEGWPTCFGDNKPTGFHGCATTHGCHCISTMNGLAGFDQASATA
jgi:uncharacterized Zn-binding protein involved in type VI secretion